MFSLKRSKKPIPGITINGTITVASPSAKYLGTHLDKKLLYSKHINETRIKIGELIGLLYCLINRKSALTTQNELTIYKALIKPVLLYAAPVWNSAANPHIQKIQTAQNKLLRMITNADRNTTNHEIRINNKIEYIKTSIDEVTRKFYQENLRHIPILNSIVLISKKMHLLNESIDLRITYSCNQRNTTPVKYTTYILNVPT